MINKVWLSLLYYIFSNIAIVYVDGGVCGINLNKQIYSFLTYNKCVLFLVILSLTKRRKKKPS